MLACLCFVCVHLNECIHIYIYIYIYIYMYIYIYGLRKQSRPTCSVKAVLLLAEMLVRDCQCVLATVRDVALCCT